MGYCKYTGGNLAAAKEGDLPVEIRVAIFQLLKVNDTCEDLRIFH